MKRLLIITPHLSTGGAPQVTANKIKLLIKDFDVMVVEHAFLAWKFIVQRERIRALVGDGRFISLGADKDAELRRIFEEWKPDVVSMEEFPEMFMDEGTSSWIYRTDRQYTILETTHDSSFNPANKKFMPDRFIFVSPYNALKYNHLEIPFEIIEYPVDAKLQTKEQSRKTLGLDPAYKHVVIIGLFTPRKNQRYAFELCNQLSDHRVKFHFLGNQADNFEFYWRPLIDWKVEDERLENCVIWGERSDTEEFLKAADLFLFPSKGDRGNKELNPIVIKEALEYESLPKLMFNLDVYLNRYNSSPNMHYLSGDLQRDAEEVLRLTGAKPISNREELVVIGTFPNLRSRVELTKSTLASVKALGRKVLLISHYPVDAETQRMADYYIYDSENPLCHHSYYTKFYRHTSDFSVDMNINGLKHSNQSLTVLTNMFTAAKFAESMGFMRFFYSTYDVVLHELDLPTVERGFEALSSGLNAYLGSLNTPFGKGIQTNGMLFRTDFFLRAFDDVRDKDSYNYACQKAGAQNFLEDYMVKRLSGAQGVEILHNPQETLLVNSGLGVASNSEYYSVLPVEKQNGEFMFYFFTYNIDDRRVSVTISEGDSEIFNGRFQISKQREFKKQFSYSGTPINIELIFFDGDEAYKTERYTISEKTMATFNSTGVFQWKNRKPKIKVVHLQTTLDMEKEAESRRSLEPLASHGFEYVIHRNEPYLDLPPTFNCARPQCVSSELFDEQTVDRLGTALTPAHYGCYDSFKSAVLSEFDGCDALILCEGDCIIETSHAEFVEAVYKALDVAERNNIGFLSFGDTKTLEQGWPQSPVVEEPPGQDLLFITNKIIGIQCVMVPSFAAKWLKEEMRTSKWDAADILFNQIYRSGPYKMGIVKSRLTTQADGYSLIDKQEKKFIR